MFGGGKVGGGWWRWWTGGSLALVLVAGAFQLVWMTGRTRKGIAMPGDMARWTVLVSKDTDVAVRALLARRGLKEGDLSNFVEDAVKWRVLEQTTGEARGVFSGLAPEALGALLDEAVVCGRR